MVERVDFILELIEEMLKIISKQKVKPERRWSEG